MLRVALSSRLTDGQPNADMKSEITTIDHDENSSPHAQEVEFALILARMINTVKQDPTQLRFTVYEFARSKLEDSISWADEEERKRLLGALEVAIKGVEQFSVRDDQSERLQPPEQSLPTGARSGAVSKQSGCSDSDRPRRLCRGPVEAGGSANCRARKETSNLVAELVCKWRSSGRRCRWCDLLVARVLGASARGAELPCLPR